MLEAKYMRLSDLRRLPGNPKDHDLGTLGASMSRFGFLDRIIVNRNTEHIVGGHGRLDDLTLTQSEGGEPPKNVIVAEDGEWLVPVDYTDLDEDEEMAAAIALNRTEEIGGWEEPLLVAALEKMAENGEDALLGTGYDLDDLDRMIAELRGPEKPSKDDLEEPDEEGVDYQTGVPKEVLERWNVKPGDVWVCKGSRDHVFVCGDCRDDYSWEAGLDYFKTSSVNGVFTSPPYADQRKSDYGGIPEEHYVTWFKDVQAQVDAHLQDDASFFVNIKPHAQDGERSLYVMDLVLTMAREWQWAFIDEFCWERISSPGAWPNRFKNGFEPVYHFARFPKIKFRPKHVADSENQGAKTVKRVLTTGEYYNVGKVSWDAALPSNHLSIKQNAIASMHPASFPVPLPAFFVAAFSDVDDLWVDPFGGSGTLALACDELKRNSLSIEQAPDYVAASLERIFRATGVEPTRVL